LIVSEAFRPLVLAQAKARNVSVRILPVRHPIGGLNAQELTDRIDSAFEALCSDLEVG
jgi:hypothetical protein